MCVCVCVCVEVGGSVLRHNDPTLTYQAGPIHSLPLTPSPPHLVSILLSEGDGGEFIVSLHEVLVNQEVQRPLLMGHDRILKAHTHNSNTH